jgi:hypothetical protein
MRQIARTGCSRLVEEGCWDHTGYPDLDTAMRSFANDRGLDDVGYRVDHAPGEGSECVVPESLELAGCDPNGHNGDRLLTVAEATEGAHHVSSIAMAPERDRWRWVPFEFQ